MNRTLTDGEKEEIWRPVPGYEGLYSVSDFGRVRREGGTPQCILTRLIKQTPRTGYWGVSLCKEGVSTSRHVHSLVAAAFIGKCPKGHQVNHKDGNKANSLLTNLEYVTHAENITHAVATGLISVGEQKYNAKLTNQHIEEIRSARGFLSQKTLAARYGVSQANIGAVQTGATWKHRPHIESSRDRLSSANKSGYLGVSWCKKFQKWEAYITNAGRRYFLGYFDDAKEAAQMRDRMAIEYHGDRAKLNFPMEDNRCAS